MHDLNAAIRNNTLDKRSRARVQLAEVRSCQTGQMPVAGRRAARHRSIKVFKRAGDPPSSAIDYKTEVQCFTTSLSCKFDITGLFPGGTDNLSTPYLKYGSSLFNGGQPLSRCGHLARLARMNLC